MPSISESEWLRIRRVAATLDELCGGLQVRVWPCGCECVECEAGHVHEVHICSMSAHPVLWDPDTQLDLLEAS